MGGFVDAKAHRTSNRFGYPEHAFLVRREYYYSVTGMCACDIFHKNAYAL